MANVVSVLEEAAKTRVADSLRAAERGAWYSLALLGGGLFLGLLAGGLVARSILEPTQSLRATVEKIAGGEIDRKVPYTDYPNEIGDLARAIAVLQGEAKTMEVQRWIKTHLASISGELQEAADFVALAQRFLSSVAPWAGIGHGVFYLYEEEEKRLRFVAGYACRERKDADAYFALGQGLVGQCAVERAPIIITDPPADYIRIGSSLGEAAPHTIALLPVLRGDRLLAVVELATLGALGPNERALLDGLMPTLAMNLEILERNVRTLEASKALDEQRSSLQRILDNMPVGTAFTASGVFRYANPAFEKMFGLRAGDQAAGIYATPEDRAALVGELQRDGKVKDRVFRLKAAGGELRDYLCTFVTFVHEGEEGIMG